MYEQDNDTAHQDVEDVNADAYFNEFAGEGAAAPSEREIDDGQASDEAEGQARDDQGRFASDDQGGEDDNTVDSQASNEAPDDELERLRQEAQQWQHRYQSDLGRQNALQRKIQELEQQNQRLSQRSAANRGDASAESADNPQGSGMSDEAWQSFKEDFPEMAQAMEKRLSAISQQYEQRIGQLESQLTPIQQRTEQQQIQTEMTLLEQQHPDWRDVVNNNDFQSWLSEQPTDMQKRAESNSAADAAYLLKIFKLEHGQAAPPANQGLQQRRQRQLQSARTVPTRGGRQRSAIPDNDEDALFDYFANQK